MQKEHQLFAFVGFLLLGDEKQMVRVISDLHSIASSSSVSLRLPAASVMAICQAFSNLSFVIQPLP